MRPLLLSPFLCMTLAGAAMAQSADRTVATPPPFVPDVKTGPLIVPKGPPSLLAPQHDGAQAPVESMPAPLAGMRTSIPLDRMHYDQPGDGHLWAMGAGYKARFSVDGVRYVPYLGPNSPVNRPLDFTLESIAVGTRHLAFEARVAAARDGDVVSYDRGTLTEYYVMAPDSMEQRFRFDSPVGPLASAGPGEDLVVRLGVATDLALAPVSSLADPGGLEWTSPLGSVRYGRATVLDADGASAPAPTRFVDGGLEIRVPAEFVSSARYPLTIDPIVSTFGVDSSDRFDLFPDIAYDRQTGRWAIVWSRWFSGADWDVWCETRSFIGSYIEGAYIDLTSETWINARVAGNRHASQYLVVAQAGPTGTRTIRGRTRQAGSTAMSPQFDVSGVLGGDKTHPDVGGDPFDSSNAYYLVVWEREFGPGDHDIHGRLVTTSGAPFGGTILINNSVDDERAPAVANSNDEENWTVAFEYVASPSDHDIRAAQIKWNGQIDYPPFTVDSSTADDRDPTVSPFLDGAYGDRPYLVAYVRNHGGDRDIQGRVLRGSTSVTASTNLTHLLGVTSFLDQGLPSAESDGSTFVLANSQNEVGSTNNNIVVGALTLANGALLRADPTTTWGGDLGHNETSVSIFSKRSGGGAPGDVLGVWNQSTDIEGGRYRSPGPGDDYCGSFPHSGGVLARLEAIGSISLFENSFSLLVTEAPPNKPGLFFVGSAQVSQPFGEGRRCVGGAVARMQPLMATDGQGRALRAVDLNLPYGISDGPPGSNFQFWFRDPQGGPAGFNYSGALHVEFQP